MTMTSNSYAMRLIVRSMSEPIAESGVAVGLVSGVQCRAQMAYFGGASLCAHLPP